MALEGRRRLGSFQLFQQNAGQAPQAGKVMDELRVPPLPQTSAKGSLPLQGGTFLLQSEGAQTLRCGV